MMRRNSLRRLRLEKLANNLLQKVGINKIPVDIETIAHELNIEVRRHPYEGDTDLSGILIRDDNKVIIGVNQKHHEHRQRFSIAHEIGHFLLHEGDKVFIDRQYKVNFRDSTSSTGTNIQEIEANTFASLLLIPEEFIEQDLQRQEIDFFDSEKFEALSKELAEKYNVSPASMMLRLSSKIS